MAKDKRKTTPKHARKASKKAKSVKKPKLKSAASAAFDITCLPGGNRPEKFEFSKLEQRLRDKLPALMSQK